jgi:hypothetical protein
VNGTTTEDEATPVRRIKTAVFIALVAMAFYPVLGYIVFLRTV